MLPTFRCVTDCIYCYADRRTKRAQFDLKPFGKLLKELVSCGMETVEFSGGDFFCRRDAFEMIAETFRHGLYPVIPTKFPLSVRQVQKLADLGLKTIQVSIDALSPDLIDRMVRRHGYGKRILNTIDLLGEAGINVRTNTVMTPFNMDDVPNLIAHLIKRPFIMKSNITCYSRSIYQHDDSMFVEGAALKIVEEKITSIISANPDRRINYGGANADYYAGGPDEKAIAYEQRAFCTANRWGVVVLPDGRVTVCEELYSHPDFVIGDLNHNSLTEIWHSAKALSLAKPVQELVPDGACRFCADYHECHNDLGRCYREAIKAYGYDRAHWPDPRCPHAPRGNPFIAPSVLKLDHLNIASDHFLV